MGVLENRRVIVTGAGQGLGRAVVDALVEAGARVVATDVPDHPGLSDIDTGTSVAAVAADLGSHTGVEELVEAAVGFFGPVNALVSCHAFMAMGRFLEQDAATWWRHIDINVRANFFLAQRLVADMTASKDGRIVFLGSEAGSIGMHEATAYSASKSAIAAMAKSMARELGHAGVVTNVIAPSYVDTPQLEVDAANASVSVDEIKRRAAATIPLGRIAQPSEIAKSVVYLLGPYGGATIGQVLNANGGSFRSRA